MISRGIILVMISVSGKIVEKIKENVLIRVTIFSSENRSVYKIMWNNTIETDRPQNAIWTKQKKSNLHAG